MAYYEDDQVTLHLGDCRELVPALGLTADCVIADPPYQETSLTWDRWPDGWPKVLTEAARSMWCFGSLRMFLDRRDEYSDWKLSQDIVWEKQNGTGFSTDRFKRVHEFAVHWYRGDWSAVFHDTPRVQVGVSERDRSIKQGAGHARHMGKIGDRGAWTDDGSRLMRSVIRAANMWRKGAIHPTQKTVGILEPLIKYACPPGGTVLDPFAGSGSTAIVARMSGRKAVLIEADERYCEAIARRLDQGVLQLDECEGAP